MEDKGISAFDVFAVKCPSRHAFDHIFSRWGMLTLLRLAEGPVRFGQLCRSVGGISEKMLSQTLRVLEEEGLILRHDWNEKPPRVEYQLSEAGHRIAGSLSSLVRELYHEMEKKLMTEKSGMDQVNEARKG